MADGKQLPFTSAEIAELYQQHRKELLRFLMGLLRDELLANDALQTAFAKLLESGGPQRRESHKSWLFRVAYNEAMLFHRRQATGKKALDQFAWMRPQSDESPEASAARRETIEQVRQTLEHLPAEQQQIVRMRIYEEKTFAAIAKELDIPLGTALGRMRSALAKMRAKLDAADD